MAALITDRVKQLVRMRGPVIPSQISKEIGTNILMASAILSELASKNDVKISSVKVGGTPLYYVVGQEPKLQNYIASLQQKEKEAFEQLKASGVLKDRALEPAIRFALRQIKDFAKPLEVNAGSEGSEPQLFWKWYLLSNEEAEPAIKKMLGFRSEYPGPQQQQSPPMEPLQAAQAAVQQPRQQTLQLQPELNSEPVPTAIPSAIAQETPKLKPAGKKTAAPQTSTSEFAATVADFLAKNSIVAEPASSTGKSEAEFVVQLPSPVGTLRYYCIAKNKKTCTDSDISSAIVQGQLKKLPVLLLTKGELSKKAQELLAKEIGAVVIKKL